MRLSRYNLDIVFRKMPPEVVRASILKNSESIFEGKRKTSVFSIPESVFVGLAFDCFDGYSQDERLAQYRKLNSEIEAGPLPDKTIFNLLFSFANEVLTTNRFLPVCKYREILRWQDTTHKLGQDLFTTIFLAKKDIDICTQNEFFVWSPIVDHDNARLKSILSKGLAENHYHLNGSSQCFPINWVLLMNHPQMVLLADQLGDNLDPRLSYGEFYNAAPWCVKLFWAASIRSYLFCKTHHLCFAFESEGAIDNGKNNNLDANKFCNNLIELLQCHDSLSVEYYLPVLNRSISVLRMLFGYVSSLDCSPLDYALEKTMNSVNFFYNRILAGERKLMYDCFCLICGGKMSEKDMDFFYLYLLIKSNFRSEFIQTNRDYGFLNFKKYQDRKQFFYSFSRYSNYNDEAYRLSLNAVLKLQPIEAMEARVMPQDRHANLSKSICHIDRIFEQFEYISNPNLNPYDCLSETKLFFKRTKSKFFYVIHYPKSKDKLVEPSFLPRPRNYNVRVRNKKYTRALLSSIESSAYLRDAILGVDACSNEIGCRPEVFAVDFRCLRVVIPQNKNIIFNKKEKPTQLNITFHVGEDFLNIIDGLRAIDECIKFIGMGQGDRFGHALALGINVRDYYKTKGYRILMPKQDALDDEVWLLYRANELGLTIPPDLERKLLQHITELMNYIYGDFVHQQKTTLSPFNHYCSWKLRGDDPGLYEKGFFEQQQKTPLFGYEQYRVNNLLKDKYLREREDITKLYYAYHYDEQSKLRGREVEVIKITEDYMDLVEQIQKKMQFYVAGRGIMIECNPTSNYLIGTINRYDKHPITAFNNLNLEICEAEKQVCAQLSVSINTDDQGVFDTLLSNEYALMSAALEQKTDENGKPVYTASQVYQYIDSVREMGLEQSFLERDRTLSWDGADL